MKKKTDHTIVALMRDWDEIRGQVLSGLKALGHDIDLAPIDNTAPGGGLHGAAVESK